MNEPSKENQAQQNASSADLQMDAALHALNSVQPAARLQQRIHARLAQEAAGSKRHPFWAGPFGTLGDILSWPRAAFALATFTAGVLAATLGLPLLHHSAAGPVASHATSGNGNAVNAGGTAPASDQPTNVHPGFTVRTADGRAAALNTQGTVATMRSRKTNSDLQLASRGKQSHVQAKLAKPARLRAAEPSAEPIPDGSTPTPASSNGSTAQPDAPASH